MKPTKETIEIEKKVSELKKILNFFITIEKPLYTRDECPFGDDHYHLSEATGGLGRWRWDCPLCGEQEEE